MPSDVLVLTDLPARGHRLARDIAPLASTRVLDIIDPDSAGVRLDPAAFRAVISDVSFGGSSTVAALRTRFRQLSCKPRLPHLCVLHEDTPRARAQAEALGADRILRADQITGHLAAALSAMLPDPAVMELAAAVQGAFAAILEAGRSTGRIEAAQVASAARMVDGALRRSGVRPWLDLIWRLDDATHQHCLLVAGLAAAFGQQIGLRRADAEHLTQAALLHDVGKVRIPLEILNKPGRLTPEERAVIQTHAAAGHAMLRDQGYAAGLLAVVRSHHEFLDGSGYPDGLAGAEIPDLVRLVTICDIYAALVEHRPYRPAMTGAAAFAILEGMAGKLDACLVEAFRPVAHAVDGLAEIPTSVRPSHSATGAVHDAHLFLQSP